MFNFFNSAPRRGAIRGIAATFLVAGVIASSIASCAQADPSPADPGTADQNQNATDDAVTDAQSSVGYPAMWRVADDDTEIILFGTFHLLPRDIEWRTDAFDDAMARTETTVTEVDTDSPEAIATASRLMQELGRNPPGVTLSSILGPERFAQMAAVADRYGVPESVLEPSRPWFAILTLSLVAMQKEGFDPSYGVETVVESQAIAEGDDIAFLESVEVQLNALTSLGGPELLAEFDVTMEQFDNFKEYTDEMVTAWRTGDAPAIEDIVIKDLRESAPKAYDALIVQRNKNWVVQLDEWLQGEGDYFVAVGAGHLVGAQSVIAMLEAKGWTVERIQ